VRLRVRSRKLKIRHALILGVVFEDISYISLGKSMPRV
jgi:hypothetical protein